MKKSIKLITATASLLIAASFYQTMAEEGEIPEDDDGACANSAGEIICTQHDYGPQGVGQCDCWDSVNGTCSIGSSSGSIDGQPDAASADIIFKEDKTSKPNKEQNRSRK